MDRKQFKKRVAEVMTKELQETERWHFVSFANEKFLGGVIIKAHGVTDATTKCWALGINPGGSVMCFPFPDDMEIPEEKYRNRLLSKEEVVKIWPDAKSIKEHEQDEILN